MGLKSALNKNPLGVAEPDSLRFNSEQDCIDFCAKAVQDSKDWLARKDLGSIQDYLEAKTEIVVRIRRGPEEFDLIFGAVPALVKSDGLGRLITPKGPANSVVSGTNDSDRNHLVLVPVSYIVQCPEQVIPSLVRLESTKARENVRGYITLRQPRALSAEVIEVLEKGKVVGPLSGVCGEGAGDMIKCGSKVAHRIPDSQSDAIRDRLDQNSLVDMLSTFRIWLYDDFVNAVVIQKDIEIPFEIVDVMLCAANLQP